SSSPKWPGSVVGCFEDARTKHSVSLLRQLRQPTAVGPLGLGLADCRRGILLPTHADVDARHGVYRGEPGMYRCANCGRSFAFFPVTSPPVAARTVRSLILGPIEFL